jgi:hypothetical protein
MKEVAACCYGSSAKPKAPEPREACRKSSQLRRFGRLAAIEPQKQYPSDIESTRFRGFDEQS